MLLQMLMWILIRSTHQVWDKRHEATGPEAWRRVLAAYRHCEDSMNIAGATSWPPTLLFNMHGCGCWGEEIARLSDIPDHPGGHLIPGGGGDATIGLIDSRSIPLRTNSPQLTRDVMLHNRKTTKAQLKDNFYGNLLRATRGCIGFHRCSKIYGQGAEDRDGGEYLGDFDRR